MREVKINRGVSRLLLAVTLVSMLSLFSCRPNSGNVCLSGNMPPPPPPVSSCAACRSLAGCGICCARIPAGCPAGTCAQIPPAQGGATLGYVAPGSIGGVGEGSSALIIPNGDGGGSSRGWQANLILEIVPSSVWTQLGRQYRYEFRNAIDQLSPDQFGALLSFVSGVTQSEWDNATGNLTIALPFIEESIMYWQEEYNLSREDVFYAWVERLYSDEDFRSWVFN